MAHVDSAPHVRSALFICTAASWGFLFLLGQFLLHEDILGRRLIDSFATAWRAEERNAWSPPRSLCMVYIWLLCLIGLADAAWSCWGRRYALWCPWGRRWVYYGQLIALLFAFLVVVCILETYNVIGFPNPTLHIPLNMWRVLEESTPVLVVLAIQALLLQTHVRPYLAQNIPSVQVAAVAAACVILDLVTQLLLCSVLC